MLSASADVLTVVTWKWQSPTVGAPHFGPEYVNRLRAALDRHVHLDHRLVCVTDDPAGLDGDIQTLPLTEYLDTPRCRRRMRQYSQAFAAEVGARMLSLDLDVVIVDDLTPIVRRRDPIVCWKVKHARVYSGSFVLMNTGVLDGLWQAFRADPAGYPTKASPHGVGSDQAMLNFYLRTQPPIPYWTEADGFVTYFGAGYEHFQHLGVGPDRPALPKGARIVVLGSADQAAMNEGHYPWILEHWGPPLASEAAA